MGKPKIGGSRRRVEQTDEWVPLGRFAVAHKTSRGRGSIFGALRAEYDEEGPRWATIANGLLKQPVPAHGTSQTVAIVGHNFDVVETMIEGMGYF